MKKILFLVLLSALFLFSFPLSGLASNYEVNVTITHLYIPERAGMILAPDRPNTEFILYEGSITAVDATGLVVARVTPSVCNLSSYSPSLCTNSTATLVFPYSASLAPYNVHVEQHVYPPAYSTYRTCMADCSSIPGGSGYFWNSQVGLLYWRSGDGYAAWATCPNNCSDGNPGAMMIGYPPTSVFRDPPSTGSYYWRSASLLAIP